MRTILSILLVFLGTFSFAQKGKIGTTEKQGLVVNNFRGQVEKLVNQHYDNCFQDLKGMRVITDNYLKIGTEYHAKLRLFKDEISYIDIIKPKQLAPSATYQVEFAKYRSLSEATAAIAKINLMLLGVKPSQGQWSSKKDTNPSLFDKRCVSRYTYSISGDPNRFLFKMYLSVYKINQEYVCRLHVSKGGCLKLK